MLFQFCYQLLLFDYDVKVTIVFGLKIEKRYILIGLPHCTHMGQVKCLGWLQSNVLAMCYTLEFPIKKNRSINYG